MRHKQLWVIDYVGTSVPEPAVSPEIPDDMVVVADVFWVVIESDYDDLEQLVSGYPYWRISGHPPDGRWIGAGGDEAYIANGRLVDKYGLWGGLGLCPQEFGAETWADIVDEREVWDAVPAY